MQNFVEASAAGLLAGTVPSRSQNECEALMRNAECRMMNDVADENFAIFNS